MASAPVLVLGAVAVAGGLAVAIRRLEYERILPTAVLAAAFFVASMIAVPLGPTSAHLMLNGLMGVLLGWGAVPAVFVGLMLQAAMFGVGGVTTLGTNTLNIALPALVCAALIRPVLSRTVRVRTAFALGLAAGGIGTALCGAMVAATLALSGSEFLPVAAAVAPMYLPLALMEGLVCGAAIAFLFRVKPEMLAAGIHA